MFFEEERIARLLYEMRGYIYPKKHDITDIKIKKGDFLNPDQADNDPNNWEEFKKGDSWGGQDERYWFRAEIVIPEEFEGKKVVLSTNTGREGNWDAVNPQFLIYLDGVPVQGLDVNHNQIIISDCATKNEKHVIDLHAYAGMTDSQAGFKASLAVLDTLTEKVYYDIKVPLAVAALLDKEDKNRIDIFNYLTQAVNLLDFRKPHSELYYEGLNKANKYLEEEFYNKYCKNNTSSVTATCIGHTHIDVAWLWTLRQTREKTARSFSTVLNLMKQYPEYLFMSSQPQLYKFLKEQHPEIYANLKERVKEGRWEPEGGMWLEADCNLTSGESLVRQILFGTRFFKQEFGVDNKILWLPDVFGYSAALPQILKKFGIDYFMTTKISWNEYNKMPYDTFNWEGIDGSEVLTYFITTRDYDKTPSNSTFTTYVGMLKPSQIMGAWQRYQQKNINDDVLVCYGYGDGGGGPTKEMLENAKRMEKGIPGCPKVKMGKSRDFFERLDKKVTNNKRLPKWVGELYLEYHRGTYTSMARNKKYNRKGEFLFEDAELFNVLNTTINNGINYPQKEINKGWETLLLNQFHDIIPGSSIKEVYEESKEQYEEVLANGNKLLNNALDQIASNIKTEEKSLVVFNQLSFARNDVVKFDIPQGMKNVKLRDEQGKIYDVQCTSNNKGLFFAEDVPAKGFKTFTILNADKSNVKLDASEDKLSNKYFEIKVDEQGLITSIYDKVNDREVLKANQKANVLQAFEDKPHNYDAWDINIYYQEKMWEVNDVESIKLIDNGPVRATLKITKKFLDSTIVQYMHVYRDIPRIDFDNEIDWKEKQVLLKAAFPVDIHSSKATYEIQYGNVERPTHWNTSWDTAKFEVCAHKWADLSEDDYGVSLLNDCKYGHDIKDSVMRLSLLKSPLHPNPDADKEVHNFTYSLYPHSGNWKDANTVQMAYELNCPMYAKVEEKHEGSLQSSYSFLNVDKENVIVEVVKKAEDSDDIIIRMYECYNRRSKVTLSLFTNVKAFKEVDLNEKDQNELQVVDRKVSFEIKPYEIKTFKVSL